jgi:hypothetical protein
LTIKIHKCDSGSQARRETKPTAPHPAAGARIDPERRKRNHIRQLEALGYKVTLDPAA